MLRHNTYRFAAFEVDPQKGELRKHGLRIKLQDQPFKILIALLETPGEVVSRDELRERIWGSETFVDFNHGLSAAVNRLRDALGDSAERPRYVETVARRGYCFIASLEEMPVPVAPKPVNGFGGSPPDLAMPAAPEPPVPPAAAANGPYLKRLWAAGVSLTALGLAGAGLWLIRNGPSHHVPPRLEQATSLIGSETMPTFSPDGRQVAFVWNGEIERNADIFVKLLGTGAGSQANK